MDNNKVNEVLSDDIIDVPVLNEETKHSIPPTNININDIKTSGTATEDEINIDVSKPTAEILDEYEIKRDIMEEQKKYKKNLFFIVVIILLIILFIIFMPYIVKRIGF